MSYHESIKPIIHHIIYALSSKVVDMRGVLAQATHRSEVISR